MMTRIKIDGSPSWPALEIVGTWNGWAVPRVSATVRDEIATWIEDTVDTDAPDEAFDRAQELRDLPIVQEGVTLDCGCAFVVVDPKKEALLMDNGLAPEGWVEVQADDEGDEFPMDEDAAIFLAGDLAMLFRPATGMMVQCKDEEAGQALSAMVNDEEDIAPSLICIIPRSIAVSLYGEAAVPR